MKQLRVFLYRVFKLSIVLVIIVMALFISDGLIGWFSGYPWSERIKDNRLTKYLSEISGITDLKASYKDYSKWVSYEDYGNHCEIIIVCYDIDEVKVSKMYSLKEPLIEFLKCNSDEYTYVEDCTFIGYIESYDYVNSSVSLPTENLYFEFSVNNPNDVFLGVNCAYDHDNRTNIFRNTFEDVTYLSVSDSMDFDITMLDNFPDLKSFEIKNEKKMTEGELREYLPDECAIEIKQY